MFIWQEEDDFIDPWCASEVDSSGGYVGEWVECNSECPVCKTVDSNNLKNMNEIQLE